MRFGLLILLCLLTTACNSIYYKPHTLDKNGLIYTPRGGYTIQRSMKEVFDERGYNIHIGTLKVEKESDEADLYTFEIPKNAKYTVYVKERKEILRPIWCAFNGFWWWNFSIAISDRKSGTEIMSWRGRGCQNSSLRKLNEILDELEK